MEAGKKKRHQNFFCWSSDGIFDSLCGEDARVGGLEPILSKFYKLVFTETLLAFTSFCEIWILQNNFMSVDQQRYFKRLL